MPTYKQFKKFLRDKCWNERDYGEGIYDKLIYDFLVEEVKENKEDVLSVKQENPHDKIKIVTPRGETIHINYDFMPSDTSILEKLREELERKVQQTIEQIEKTQQIRDCERLNVLREIQYLLTSLEQPQTKVDTEAKVWQVIAENIK